MLRQRDFSSFPNFFCGPRPETTHVNNMNKILPIASLVLAAGALTAQTGMNVKADINVSANKVVKTLKKGAVKTSAYASARDGKSWWRPNASASKSVRHYVSRYSGNSYASVSDRASAAKGTNKASVAQGSVDVTIKAAKAGSLVLTYYGRGKAALKVSGGATWAPKADGKKQSMTVKITKAGTISFNVASNADAIATAKASAYSSNSFSAVFIPAFNGTKCTITNTGGVKGCSGTLTGTSSSSGTRHLISLNLKGAAAKSWFINVVAASTKNPIKLSNNCLLLAGPHWAGFGRTDTKGNGTSRFSVSARKALSAHIQSVTFSFGSKSFSLKTSNSIGIVCK